MATKCITTSQLIDRIKKPLQSRTGNRPPFTLIMGSGCSFPLIPTTSRIVCEDLPWWLLCKACNADGPQPSDFANPAKAKEFEAQRKALAADFWKEARSSSECGITLDGDGLPTKECIAEAYKFALSADCSGGLSTPDEVRRYFAALVARVGNRLNPMHLYLASLVAEEPRLFGTIFTTNFDPLLQRGMQMVNVPYFVSDRPGAMQHPDDDDAVEALHLVYAHGSIYRYLLLNSPEQIDEFATRNQSLFQEYLRKHAVLIIGYSGWDDSLTRALMNVDQFDHNLYWCARGATLEASGLSPIAKDILKKHSNAFYVGIESADQLMLELHQAVTGHTLPRLVREPIAVMLGQLTLCDLTGMKISRPEADDDGDALASTRAGGPPSVPSGGGSGASASTTGRETLDLGAEVRSILDRLQEADRHFKGTSDESVDATSRRRAQVLEKLSLATDLYFGPKSVDAIPHFDFVLAHADVLDASEKAWTLFRRGYTYSQRGAAGDIERAIADYTAVVEMPDAPAEPRAKARVNRGYTYGQRGETGDIERKIADCTAVVEMPDAPAEQRARARTSRGYTYGRRGEAGDIEREIADYTAVIEMPDAPAEERGMARANRGFTYGQRGEAGDIERAIADCTAVVEMPDAPAEQRVNARVIRGATYGQRGEAGDIEREIADYTAVVEAPDAPAEQSARARVNRGITYGQRGEAGDIERAIADYTAVVEMPDAPAEQSARARVNRGVIYGKRAEAGDIERAIADYTAVIEMRDASAEERATAHVYRGMTYGQRGEAGDIERAIADYTVVIEMPDAPAEQSARARVNRGVTYGKRAEAGDIERELADYTAVVEAPDAPAEQRAMAHVYRGMTYAQRGEAGDTERAIADYAAVIEMPDAPAEERETAQQKLDRLKPNQ